MKKYEFPRLYLKTSSGKIRFIDYWVSDTPLSIHSKYGFLDSDKIIEPIPQYYNKKDMDKLIKLTKTKWEKKISKGYTKVLPKNFLEKSFDKKIIIYPMKAYDIKNREIIYPAYIQPKIDGNRAILDLNKYEFLSSTIKPYNHLEHLRKDIDKIKEKYGSNIYLDGELYIDNVHKLRSILSTHKLDVEQEKLAKNIKYYVFDIIDKDNLELNYYERYKILKNIFKIKFNNMILVDTIVINNSKDLDKYYNYYVKNGYEGIIVRNFKGIYKIRGKSLDVLKSKDVSKKEFTIIGYKQGTGNDTGTVIWQVKCANSNRNFWVKPMGTREDRKLMYKNADKYIGKKLLIKYFDIDNDGCVTKNPIGGSCVARSPFHPLPGKNMRF